MSQAAVERDLPPCVLFEDEHLLVVNKPARMNTHAPSPYAGEGIYDWLRHREPRWATLAIIHRLDKETSGVMVFSKTPVANRSLTEQFTQRQVKKKYLLLTDRPVTRREFTVKSCLVRSGEKYLSRPLHGGGDVAETRFRVLSVEAGRTLVVAEPVTGKTHQIRVHAAENGFPVLGDTLYGGSPAARVCLHADELVLHHPATGEETRFQTPAEFSADPRQALRTALIDPQMTNAYRLVHGAADGWPGWYVDRLGEFLLSQSEQPLGAEPLARSDGWLRKLTLRGAYHKRLSRQLRQQRVAETSPRLALGEAALGEFTVRENGVRFALSFSEGYSVGLFLDQRDNRRRFLVNHVAAGFPLFPNGPRGAEVLNTFAYTCGFSVCAALAGARATSLDLSKKYLDWGKRNFALNDLDPAQHDFIYGDVFDWLKRLRKKGRLFDAIVLDPPTFSQSKEHGAFRAEKDFGELAALALPLLKSEGVLFCSTNAAGLRPETFLQMILAAVAAQRRHVLKQHDVPQPPDFPISREEPAYLKTVWLPVA
ncbi:MAG: class I SAM-dependent methyltransferase [Verrucomicrobia bacterium]|nr:class I SAM-dependent methyltransferase [Verrucomicrobiota bacterium]